MDDKDYGLIMKTIKTPFQFIGGSIGSTSDPTTIAKQKIADVLQTTNYERVLRPNYGSTIKYLVHDVMEEAELADIRVEAVQDLAEYISTFSIVDVQFDTSSVATGDSTLNLYVSYRLPLGVVSTSSVQIAISGLITEDTQF